VIEARADFSRRLEDLPVRHLVFIDESGAKTNMTRRYGRSRRGERCHFAVPHGHWQTTTMISALRCTGVIRQATMVFDGPTDATVFRGYVERCLAPALQPGDVVVMDNLAAHKVSGVRGAIEAVGAEVVYLPPYSPDLNPIEKLWSKVKTWLRRAGPRGMQGLIDAIGDAFHRVEELECRNYFNSCGYATNDR
jgi:transposase